MTHGSTGNEAAFPGYAARSWPSSHVSVDYVVRLEQGRTRRVSRPVLDALADALQFAADERDYLFTVADVDTHANQFLVAYTATPNCPSHEALHFLLQWSPTPTTHP